MASCAKHVFLVTDESKIEATMRSAFDIARSGRPGPVVVDIPRDVQLAQSVYAELLGPVMAAREPAADYWWVHEGLSRAMASGESG